MLVLIGLIAASCGSGTIAGPPMYSLPTPTPSSDDSRDLYDPIGGYPTQYYPYVEEIRMPGEIVENEPFVIEMHVSAEFRPKVLWGYEYPDKYGEWDADADAYYEFDEFLLDYDYTDPQGVVHFGVVDILTIVWNPKGEGPPVTTLYFHVPGLPAGEYEMLYFTVDERQYGGIGGPASEWGMQGDPELFEHVRALLRTFEVVPAESAE